MFTRFVKKEIKRKLLSTNTSGHAGVYFHKPSKKWRAVAIGQKRQTLGNFEKIQDAIKARKEHEVFYNEEKNNGKN